MEIILNNVCGSWSPPLTDRGSDQVRLTCTKQRNHGGKHRASIEWDEESDQMTLDIDTGEVGKS